MKFKITQTHIDGILIIEPTIFKDERGFFMETYNKKDFLDLGISVDFVQDNYSKSQKGVLRGLHFQTEYFVLYIYHKVYVISLIQYNHLNNKF